MLDSKLFSNSNSSCLNDDRSRMTAADIKKSHFQYVFHSVHHRS